MKAQDNAELFFDNVRVPATTLSDGKKGQAFFQLIDDLPCERLVSYPIARMFADARMQRI
jgi:acyl-CoA dehydrogenase